MFKVTRYARKPFLVDAALVTAGNIEEVAKWCRGEVIVDENTRRKYIKVDVVRPLNEKQTMAFIGDWVLFAGTSFKVYSSKAFAQVFDPVSETDPNFDVELTDRASVLGNVA